MTHRATRELRTSAIILLAGLCSLVPAGARAQLAAVVNSSTRYAGNSTGASGFNQDTGTAVSTSLSSPSYAVFDSAGDLFLSDTQNNCVRRIDPSGNVTTVAGLRVNGGPDTCNTASNASPAPTEGLLKPTGLALDSAGTLYISDSGHNCVRSLASGAVDSYAANALNTAAGTCTATDTASVTPVPNGLAVDSTGSLYISIQDTAAATPVNQVVKHAAADPATTVCYVAGAASANVATACAGVTGTASLSSPAGLAIDPLGDLFIADSGNNCVRELAGLVTLQTEVGQCANDHSGSTATALQSPYGLALTPGAMLLITQASAAQNSVLSFALGTGALTAVAGLPSGASGPYSSSQDGQSALSTPLNLPLGITADTKGNIYLADSGNNVIRRLSTDLSFPATNIGATSATQTITFAIYSAANLSATVGADYSITANTCSGALSPASAGSPPTTCQVTVAFTPTRPGTRSSALVLKDSGSGALASAAVTGVGVGPLSLLSPGNVSSFASGLRAPIAISVDSAGNTYVLEQGDAVSTADLLFYPAGSTTPTVKIPQGGGIQTPTAMAVDAAGNVYIADASGNTISRFGADGSVNTSYITNVPFAVSLAFDASGNLYIAQAGNVHDVIEVYTSGIRRVIAGTGATSAANGVAALSALFVKPAGVAIAPDGTLAIADSSGSYVYTVDASGMIHIVAGNGTANSTDTTQGTGTAILYPVGLMYDAAGDLYIADNAADLVFELHPVQSSGSNISVALGTGTAGYSGDGGLATTAKIFEPLTLALDGSSNLYVVDFGNNAVREVQYPAVSTLNFGHVTIGSSPVLTQTVEDAGNASLGITTPFTTTDTHYTVASGSTTCGNTLTAGGTCTIGYAFTPTAIGVINATSTVTSTAYDSPQTINLTGYGLQTQNLSYTLPAETEVYGQPFLESVNYTLNYPDLVPSGTMAFVVGAELTCSTASPFNSPVNCNAPESGLGVGTYTVNFSFTSTDQNYFSAAGQTTLTITPGSLTVIPSNETKAFGAPIPALPVSVKGEVNGDVFLTTGSTTATQSSPVGTYPISGALTPVGLASLSNYNVTYLTGTLTITGAPLTVTVANASRPYGAANPTFTSTVVGAQNGDTFTVTYSTTATATSPVGTYPILATVTGSNISNYSVTTVAGTLTVTPIPLTVNVASASRPYGTANPTFSATISGAINGDTFTQTLSTTATTTSPVGTYPINDVLSGPAAANYTITVNPGTLTVTKATATVTVTANNATRVYGAANPVFTSTVAGAINSDTFTITYTTPATPTSPAGTYAITPVVSGAAAANYNIVTVNGTLMITQATLTIAVNSVSRPFGANNPILTGTVTGAVNGDNIAVVYVTTATAASAPGTYPITATISGAVSTDYAVNIVPGTLTVTLAPTSTTLTTSSGTVDSGTSVTFTATVTSTTGTPGGTVTFSNGSTVLGTATLGASGTATFSTSTLPPGNLTIAASYGGSTDFAASSATVSQIITPGSFTLSATPPTQFVRGAGTTTYTITATSKDGYNGPVNLTCAGLPADAKCAFDKPSLTLTAGSSATATMTVTSTAADAELQMPNLPTKQHGSGLGSIAFAALLPFELTGLGVLLAGRRRRGTGDARQNAKLRLLLALVCAAGLVGLTGCACFTSIYKNYTINVTGTTTVQGVSTQATSVILSVGQQ